MTNKLESYLESDTKKMLIQPYVETSLLKRINVYRKKKSLSWSELVTALFKRLVDEEDL